MRKRGATPSPAEIVPVAVNPSARICTLCSPRITSPSFDSSIVLTHIYSTLARDISMRTVLCATLPMGQRSFFIIKRTHIKYDAECSDPSAPVHVTEKCSIESYLTCACTCKSTGQ